MTVSAQKRRATMESLTDTIKLLTDLYSFDKSEAYFVLAALQSVVFAYTLEPSEDDPTREEIFARAEIMLDEQAVRLKREKQMKEGKNEKPTFFSKRLEDLSKDEIELRDLLDIFFSKVAEMPMIDQVHILADFQDFLVEKRGKNE